MNASKLSALLASLVPAAAIAVSSPASAAPRRAKVHLQVPVDINNPANTDLDKIESYGMAPIWSKSFSIPYDSLEKTILKEIKKALAKEIPSGVQTETCTDPCPDVDWEVTYTPTFKFTKKNNVKFEQIGKSGENKIRASVKFRAKAGISGNLHAEADVPTPMPVGFIITHEEVDTPFSLFVEAEFDASVEIELWPDIDAGDVKIDAKIIDTSPNIELNGVVAELGAKIGLLIGGTPFGLMAGGPLTFSTLLAVIGDTAADIVEGKMEGYVSQMVEKHFNESLEDVEKAAKSALDSATSSANAKKNKALTTKLPGVGKSINELKSDLGGDIELHTVTPGGDLSTSAVLRLNPKSGSASMGGDVRIPARQCVYVEFMGGKMPAGYEPINTALDAKVGNSCSSAMSGVELDSHAYLGANPQKALGSSADKLSSWKSMGNTAFTGTLSKTSEYYKCGFSVTSMPNTAIMELSLKKGGGLDIKEDKERFLVRRVGGATVVLDSELKLESNAFVGGSYGCSLAGGPKLTPSKVTELKDLLDNCPQCGRIRALDGSTIYELENIAEVTGSGIGKEVTDLVKKHGVKAPKTMRKGLRNRIGRKGMTKGKAWKKSTKATPMGKTKKSPVNKGVTKGKASKTSTTGSVKKGATKGATKGMNKSKAGAVGKAGPG